MKIAAAQDGTEVVFKSKQTVHFQVKLVYTDSEHMGVSEETYYATEIDMPSLEHKRVPADLSVVSGTITMHAQKQSATLGILGDICNGAVRLYYFDGNDGVDGVSFTVKSPIMMMHSDNRR